MAQDSKPVVVVTGFQPFGGLKTNPALEAVMALPDEMDGIAIRKVEVPVVYARAGRTVLDVVEETGPVAVVLVGQAQGRSAVTVERVAVNIDDCAQPDNAGEVRAGVPVRPDGPAAYFSTLPLREAVRAVCDAGVPAAVSDSAGTYVCNHLMYEVLDALNGRPGIVAGFVHVPLMHSQVIQEGLTGQPSLSLRDITTALEALVRAVAEPLDL